MVWNMINVSIFVVYRDGGGISPWWREPDRRVWRLDPGQVGQRSGGGLQIWSGLLDYEFDIEPLKGGMDVVEWPPGKGQALLLGSMVSFHGEGEGGGGCSTEI